MTWCPDRFSDINTYLNSAYDFLNKYKWIFDTTNTKFIYEGVLNRIPEHWRITLLNITNEEFNLIPFGYYNIDWPHDLTTFLIELNGINPYYKNSYTIKDFPSKKLLYVNSKKLYEINYLTEKIHEICSNDIDILIDFGSGLGYISQILYEKYNYKILGLELDNERVIQANRCQEKGYPESIKTKSIYYVQHIITAESSKFIENQLQKYFQISKDTKIAIIGLHACADLTVDAIKLFLNMKLITKMIIMPCCYHIMKMKNPSTIQFPLDTKNDVFVNIPISKEMQKFADIINRPFLRLAGQQTTYRWKMLSEDKHKQQGQNMFERGILECIIKSDEFVEKSHRSKKNINNDLQLINFPAIFKSYIIQNSGQNQYVLKTTPMPWTDEHAKQYEEIYRKYENGGKLSEILICLQTSVQLICENIVFLDKYCYIQEKSFELNLNVNVDVQKIMDDAKSSRCLAFIVEKN